MTEHPPIPPGRTTTYTMARGAGTEVALGILAVALLILIGLLSILTDDDQQGPTVTDCTPTTSSHLVPPRPDTPRGRSQ